MDMKTNSPGNYQWRALLLLSLPYTSGSPLSRVFALLKDSINLKWTKESSKQKLPVFLSLTHIQVFPTPAYFHCSCPIQLFLFLFCDLKILCCKWMIWKCLTHLIVKVVIFFLNDKLSRVYPSESWYRLQPAVSVVQDWGSSESGWMKRWL